MDNTKKNNLVISKKTFDLTTKCSKKNYADSSPNWEANVVDQLNIERASERAGIIKKLIKYDKKKKILEIGSGAGLLAALLSKDGYIVYGLEIDEDSYNISVNLFKENGLDPSRIFNTSAETYELKNTYDLIVSFQVIEHVSSPEKVFRKCYNNLKDEGFIYFVIPNYRSFWEGHYALLWFPFLNKKMAKYYVRMFKRNDKFIDSLTFITPNIIKNITSKVGFQIISLGKEVFKKRMLLDNYSLNNGHTRILQKPLSILGFLGLKKIISRIFLYLDFYYPIILYAKKSKNN